MSILSAAPPDDIVTAVPRPRPPSPPSPPSSSGTRRGAAAALVVLLVGVLASGVAAWQAHGATGSWTSQVRVLFLIPRSALNPNALAASSDSVISTAGVVGRIVVPTVDAVVSDSVTLADEGVEHGIAVRLPDSGGQWATNFDQPALDVQAVGSTAAEVDRRMAAVLARIRRTLADLQTAGRVAPVNLITLSLSPPSAPARYVQGSPTRAVGGTLLLGALLSLTAAGFARRVVEKRSVR